MKKSAIKKSGKTGFSLVELALAIGIVAFCLVALLGVIPAGLRSQKMSVRTVTAADILTAISADMEISPSDSAESPLFGIHVPIAGEKSTPQYLLFDENGALADSKKRAVYRAEIVWMPEKSGQLASRLTNIRVAWPANGEVRSQNIQHFTETITAFNKN